MKENILKMLIRLLSKGSCALRGRRELPDPDTVRRVVVLQMSGIGDPAADHPSTSGAPPYPIPWPASTS